MHVCIDLECTLAARVNIVPPLCVMETSQAWVPRVCQPAEKQRLWELPTVASGLDRKRQRCSFSSRPTPQAAPLSPLQVYALTTALCVSSTKSTKRSTSRERSGRDEDATAADAMSTDDAIDRRDDGPSFGRMVVDGCCHAFARALRKVCFMLCNA